MLFLKGKKLHENVQFFYNQDHHGYIKGLALVSPLIFSEYDFGLSLSNLDHIKIGDVVVVVGHLNRTVAGKTPEFFITNYTA